MIGQIKILYFILLIIITTNSVGLAQTGKRLMCRYDLPNGNIKIRATACSVTPRCPRSFAPITECAAVERGCDREEPITCGNSLCEAGEQWTCADDCKITGAPYNENNYNSIRLEDGTVRTYMVHVPACYEQGKRIPLVLALHGGAGTGEAFERQMSLNQKANEECFIAVYPNGTSVINQRGRLQMWNSGPRDTSWYPTIKGVDDVGFVTQLINHLHRQYSIDYKRVYATGISNGGRMAYRLACERSRLFAAIAPMGSPMDVEDCEPGKGVPIIHFHGMADKHNPFLGGTSCHEPSDPVVPSSKETFSTWMEINECDHRNSTITYSNGEAECRSVACGRDETEMVLCTIANHGHTVPGGYAYPIEKLVGVGKISRDINATNMMWDFFNRHTVTEWRDKLHQDMKDECLQKDWEEITVNVGGLDRKLLWKSPGRDWQHGAIIAMHGGGGTGAVFCSSYDPTDPIQPEMEFSDLALNKGFAIFALDSTDGLWTDANGVPCQKRFQFHARQSGDNIDISFIEKVIDRVIPSLRSGRSSPDVFLTGLSTGGFMTTLAATQLSHKVTAFAPVASGDPYGVNISCNTYIDIRPEQGTAFDNDTGRSIIQSLAARLEPPFPHEQPWPLWSRPTAFKQFYHLYDGVVGFSVMLKARTQLRRHRFQDAGLLILSNTLPPYSSRPPRRLAYHQWQSSYNEPMLRFFVEQRIEEPEKYLIGGTIHGLTGTVILQNDDFDPIPVSRNGNFVFKERLSQAERYRIRILEQPTGQSCVVFNGRGLVLNRDALNIEVRCRSRNLDSMYFPPHNRDFWESVSPEAIGWKNAPLVRAAEYARQNNSKALLVLYKGRRVLEEYWDGWDIHTSESIYSATKSMVSAMFGIAKEQGLLSLTAPVSTYLGQGWSNASRFRERRIKVHHILNMTSGLDLGLNYRFPTGSNWEYLNGTYYKSFDVLERGFNLSRQQLFQRYLFDRIGMRDTRFPIPSLSVRLKSSARDMARFAILVSNDGNWKNDEIIGDKQYLHHSLSFSQQFNPSYGYLWWLNGKDFYLGAVSSNRINGPIFPDGPEDIVAALGHGDKLIIISPSTGVIIIRHGGSANSEGPVPMAFVNTLIKKVFEAREGKHVSIR